MYKIDEEKVYYFTCLLEDKYRVLFVGWLRSDLIAAFKVLDGAYSQAFIQIKVGSNTFISIVDRPLYLVEYDKQGIHEFAGDKEELEIFPGIKNPPNLNIPKVIAYPSYFTNGIAPMLDLKLGPKFCANRDGKWVPLEI